MCHDPVDSELFEQYCGGGRMTVKKQAAFCRLHKQKDAQIIRKNRGYPDVGWDDLESRMKKYQSFLREVLEGQRSSHYASILQDKIESGKERTILKTDDNFTPGYYGPRGLRVMTDFIMKTLSETVRARAIEDRVVSARGYTGYVQAVLVPELAVRLIMDDMTMTEEKARETLEKSSALGVFLHEEARDVITKEDDIESRDL